MLETLEKCYSGNMLLLKILFMGVGILVCAIVLNVIASRLGLVTWYDFLNGQQQTSLVSYIWLFIIYPFSLGAVAYGISRRKTR